MKKISIAVSMLLLLSLAVAEENYAYIFRDKGIGAVEEKLKESMLTTKFWESVLKSHDTKYGYFEKLDHLLICEKNRPTLSVHKRENNKYKQEQQIDAIIGRQKGDKREEGDMKTPNGVYKLTKKISKLDAFYGPLAYVTSYPNTFDKISGKNGSGIWIHGMPMNGDRERATKGCIAIDNSELVSIDKEINYSDSLLFIDDGTMPKVDKNDLIALLVSLYKWKDAWERSEIDKYLSFYNKNFKRYDGKNLKKFTKYKKRIFRKNEKKSIIFKNINIIPYPSKETSGMYYIAFHEEYKSSSYFFNGPKELFVTLNSDKMSIITER